MKKLAKTALIGSLIATTVACSDNPFSAKEVAPAQNTATDTAKPADAAATAQADDKAAEGKCGEGKCGEGKCGGATGTDGKAAEGTCGGKTGDKAAEGKCGEGKCGGKTDAKPADTTATKTKTESK